jgi:hypothetical protein
MRASLGAGFCILLVLGGPGAAQTVTTVTYGPTGAITQTQTQTTIPNAVGAATAQVGLESAQAGLQSAQISAATAAVPGSGIAPTTTPGSGTGTEEGSLLAASATKVAARYLNTLIPSKKLLVFVGAATLPDTTPWIYFQNQTGRLLKDIQSDESNLSNIISPPQGGAKVKQAFAILALPLAAKFLSYAYTSYQVQGAALTVDDYMMDVAMLEMQPNWQLYSQFVSVKMPDDIKTPLDNLDTETAAATKLIIEGQRFIARISNGKAKNTPDSKAKVAAATAAIASLTGDITAYVSFTSAISGGTGLTLSAVLQGHAMYKALHDPDAGVAFVKVHSASVGVITKSNLFTNLGAMPLYTSIGLVVSFVYYPPNTTGSDDLSAPKAGLFEVMTPYHTAGTVREELALDAVGSCVLGPKTDENAGKLCPQVFGVPSR